MAKESVRNTRIRVIGIIATISLMLGVVSLCLYRNSIHPRVMNYKEKSNIDYKVYLKENKFYKEDYVEKDNQYISELIKTIKTDFHYDLDLSKYMASNYSYRIVAEVIVKEVLSDNTIYRFEDELFKSDLIDNRGKISIDKSIDLDYSKYNETISSFKDVYQLINTASFINLKMYLNVDGMRNMSDAIENKSVASLKIPLAENTINIENTNHNLENTVSLHVDTKKENTRYGILSIISFAFGIVLLTITFIYVRKTRTAAMIYRREIKNITNSYDSFIQRISGTYDIGTSQVIKLESFSDVLEVRDTLKQPILMLENENKTGTFFIIPATNSIIYTYALRIVDIEAKMEGKEKPDYEATEIPHEKPRKRKKYTKNYIEEEITRTSLTPIVDSENVIKGNKDKELDLYDQLELTRSFSVEEIKRAVKKAKKEKDKRAKREQVLKERKEQKKKEKKQSK